MWHCSSGVVSADGVESGIYYRRGRYLPRPPYARAGEATFFAESALRKGPSVLSAREKDRVKLDDTTSFCIPVVWVQMELQVVKGLDAWDAFLQAVESRVK